MKCAIMQPTYLPWAGYFNLISKVDKFVLLDDVQFERRSWQSRNRVLLSGREHYLTVPVAKADRDEKIMNIKIHYEYDWHSQHLGILKQAYGKTAYGSDVIDMVATVFAEGYEYLVDINQDLIIRFADYMGIKTPLLRSSALDCGGARSEHLAQICLTLDCGEYLSPVGSREYLMEDHFAEKAGISLEFQDFKAASYSQTANSEFVSHLSIVDVLANHGPEYAYDYVSGSLQ